MQTLTRTPQRIRKPITAVHFATTNPPILVTVDTCEKQGSNASLNVTTVLRLATTTFEMRRPNASPKVTTIPRFATTTLPIFVKIDTFEMRRPNASPKVRTVPRFATTTLPIVVKVDTFETRRPNASPKVSTVLRFATILDADTCGHIADTRLTLANAAHGFCANSQPADLQPQNENPSAAQSGKIVVQHHSTMQHQHVIGYVVTLWCFAKSTWVKWSLHFGQCDGGGPPACLIVFRVRWQHGYDQRDAFLGQNVDKNAQSGSALEMSLPCRHASLLLSLVCTSCRT